MSKRKREDVSKGDSLKGSFERARSLRLIIREQFAARGVSPAQKDADLSTKLGNEALKILDAGGVSEPIKQRRIQLFASATLLEVKLGRMPEAEELAPFLVTDLGINGASALDDEDRKALNETGAHMHALLSKPEWASVHGGHIAMMSLSLLSLFDISVLNISYPG